MSTREQSSVKKYALVNGVRQLSEIYFVNGPSPASQHIVLVRHRCANHGFSVGDQILDCPKDVLMPRSIKTEFVEPRVRTPIDDEIP